MEVYLLAGSAVLEKGRLCVQFLVAIIASGITKKE